MVNDPPKVPKAAVPVASDLKGIFPSWVKLPFDSIYFPAAMVVIPLRYIAPPLVVFKLELMFTLLPYNSIPAPPVTSAFIVIFLSFVVFPMVSPVEVAVKLVIGYVTSAVKVVVLGMYLNAPAAVRVRAVLTPPTGLSEYKEMLPLLVVVKLAFKVTVPP